MTEYFVDIEKNTPSFTVCLNDKPKSCTKLLAMGKTKGLQSIKQQKATSTHRHTTSRWAGRQWASIHTLSKEKKLDYPLDFQLIGVSLVHALSYTVLLCYSCRA